MDPPDEVRHRHPACMHACCWKAPPVQRRTKQRLREGCAGRAGRHHDTVRMPPHHAHGQRPAPVPTRPWIHPLGQPAPPPPPPSTWMSETGYWRAPALYCGRHSMSTPRNSGLEASASRHRKSTSMPLLAYLHACTGIDRTSPRHPACVVVQQADYAVLFINRMLTGWVVSFFGLQARPKRATHMYGSGPVAYLQLARRC